MCDAAGVEITVVDWNLIGWHTISDEHLALLDRHAPDVLLLQEVTTASFDRLVERGPWAGQIAATHLPGRRGRSGSPVRSWAAVLVRPPLDLATAAPLAGAPWAEQTLIGRVDGGALPFAVASAAAPPNRPWGKEKAEQERLLAAHLATLDDPAILGMDRHGPREEHPAEGPRWWREDYPELFAPDADHGLRDVWLDHLDRHADLRAAIAEQRPDGPLAISFSRPAEGQRFVPARYDLIMASRAFTVLDTGYAFEDGVAAGSTHALVWARLRLQPAVAAPDL